jgi:hypothetical protein
LVAGFDFLVALSFLEGNKLLAPFSRQINSIVRY